jgi:hypothetical protein
VDELLSVSRSDPAPVSFVFSTVSVAAGEVCAMAAMKRAARQNLKTGKAVFIKTKGNVLEQREAGDGTQQLENPDSDLTVPRPSQPQNPY